MKNEMILLDANGKEIKARILYTHYSYDFKKQYIIYLIDDELLAGSIKVVNNKHIIDGDLTSAEFDMLDDLIEKKLGEIDGY